MYKLGIDNKDTALLRKFYNNFLTIFFQMLFYQFFTKIHHAFKTKNL